MRFVKRSRAGTRLLLIGALALVASDSRAADTWSTPAAGLKRLRRKTSNQNINVLIIDLCRAGISLRATASAERKRSVSSFGGLVGAAAAINGDFFSFTNYQTNGLAMGGGALWPGVGDHSYVAPVAIGKNKVAIPHHANNTKIEPWMEEIVSGHPTLLDDGKYVGNNGDPLCTVRHPRTAIGINAEHSKMIWAVVDGRASTRIGMTCAELATLLKEFGAFDAVNLDGGGSSTMWIGGVGVVNYPSDGKQRIVANHLAVRAKGSGPAPHCNGHPLMTITSHIQPIKAQPADLCQQGDSSGIFDWFVGQQTTVHIDVKNSGAAVARHVAVGVWAELPYLTIERWNIYTNWKANGGFVLNDTDGMQTIPHDNPGQSFTLQLASISPGETKRIKLAVRAQQYSIGAADHPDVRAWIGHVDDHYAKQDFWSAFNNVGNHQQQNGGDLRAFSQTDVLREEQCDGIDDDCDGLVDEDQVCGADAQPGLPEPPVTDSGPGPGANADADAAAWSSSDLAQLGGQPQLAEPDVGCSCDAAGGDAVPWAAAPLLVLLVLLGAAASRRRGRTCSARR